MKNEEEGEGWVSPQSWGGGGGGRGNGLVNKLLPYPGPWGGRPIKIGIRRH